MTTPNAAELRAAEKIQDNIEGRRGMDISHFDDDVLEEMKADFAKIVSKELHLDEVREAIVSAQQKLGGGCDSQDGPYGICPNWLQTEQFCAYCKLQQALKHLSE